MRFESTGWAAMPFGLIFGALFFLLAAALFGLPVVGMMAPPFRGTEILLGLLMLFVAIGLLARQAWARWLAIVIAGVMAWMRLMLAVRSLYVVEFLILFAAILTVVLLVVPATGDVRRGLPDDRRSGSRFGRILGIVTAVLFVGALSTFGLTVARYGASRPAAPSLADLGIHSVKWNEFGPGMEKARLEGKPVLVDFFAEWCGPCKVMDRKTFRHPEVARRLSDVVAVRIDAEGTEPIHGYVGEDLANRYGVVSYPTVVLMDADGREIARSRGAKGPADFLAWLEVSLAVATEARPPGDAEPEPKAM